MEEKFEKIKEEVKEVVRYSQGIKEPVVDRLLERWYEAKKPYINQMGGELIYEFPEPITFEMSSNDKKREISDFLTEIDVNYCNYDLIRFIESMSSSSFYANTVEKDYIYSDGIIPKGMKLIKAFRYFVKDKEDLTNIQMMASRIIQKDKITGKLCISVHPLDFLSSSQNNHNWRSCHSLDGEFRAGNLSYMVDRSTVICYLKSEEDAYINNFTDKFKWNNKKWRMLLFFSTNGLMAFAGRQYPFFSDTALDLVKTFLMPKLTTRNWPHNWSNQLVNTYSNENETVPLTRSYIPIYGKLVPINDLIISPTFPLHFNDLLHSHSYKPYFTTALGIGSLPPSTVFEIGGEIACLEDEEEKIELPQTMRSIKCEEKYGTEPINGFMTCGICGRRVYEENAIWMGSEGMDICRDCYEDSDVVVSCDYCGQPVLADKALYVYDEDGYPIKQYCDYCYEYER